MTALAALVLLVQGSLAPVRAPLLSARITPETPAIGEVITIELRVRAPTGTEVRFPALPDSLHRVEALDPRELRDASSATLVDRTAIYRLIAFDTGQATVRLGDVTVRRDGAETRHRVVLAPLRIRSVLPRDRTGRIPRPARAPLDVPSMRWRWWIALVVVFGLGSWVLWNWRRARRAGREAPDAAVRARSAFAHARALGLLDVGEPGRHALAHVEIVRDYLASRFPGASRSLTGTELAATLPTDLPILPQRVADLVGRVERVAFANAPLAAPEAEALAGAAIAVVEDLEKAWQARRARDAARTRAARRRP